MKDNQDLDKAKDKHSQVPCIETSVVAIPSSDDFITLPEICWDWTYIKKEKIRIDWATSAKISTISLNSKKGKVLSCFITFEQAFVPKEVKLPSSETECTDVYKIKKAFIYQCKYSDNKNLTKWAVWRAAPLMVCLYISTVCWKCWLEW